MSLGIWLTMDFDAGGPAPYHATLADLNITHNVIPMWRLAGVVDALYESHGTLAGEHLDVLQAGVLRMKTDPAAYRGLNPANGWGNYEGALRFLEEWLAACEAHPKATIGVSR